MNKRIFAILVAMCVVLPVMAGVPRSVKADSLPVLSLQSIYTPSSTVAPRELNQTFALKLHVDNVTDLWSWKVKLTWDPLYLRMTSDPTEEQFLNAVNGTLFLSAPYANTPGTINLVSDTSLGSLGATGNGDLATFTFTVIAHGYNYTTINVTDAVMQDFNNPIAFTTVGATVVNTIPGDCSSNTAGVPDGTVNMRDIGYAASLFGTNPSKPNWNPIADLNLDGRVDMRDIGIAAAHFGQRL